MAETRAKPWTEAEKLSVLFQIIESAPIPWDTLTLPEGRTKKAVQVMIDREKSKMKKARAGEKGLTDSAGAADEIAGKTKGKRKADGEAGGGAKKAKTSRKKTKAEDDVEEGKGDGEVEDVKTEQEEEEA